MQPPATKAPLFLSVRDARQMLGVGHTTLYALLKNQQLRARKIGGKTLVEMQSLHEFASTLPPLYPTEAQPAAATVARRITHRRH